MLKTPESIASKPLTQDILEQVLLDLALAPAERLLILIQTQPEESSTLTISDEKAKHYGIRHYTKRIMDQEGFWGFWKGCTFEIIKNVAFRLFHSFFLHLYEPLMHIEDTTKNEFTTMLKELFLFYIVETSLQVIQYPTRVIRVRLAALEIPDEPAAPRGFKKVSSCIRRIWKEDGFTGFYRGFGVSLLESLVKVTTVTLERSLAKRFIVLDDKEKSLLNNLEEVARERSVGSLVSAFLKATGTGRDITKRIKSVIFQLMKGLGHLLIFYPFRVVQRRIIMCKQNLRAKRISTREIIREMWRRESIIGFYSGFRMQLLISLGNEVFSPLTSMAAGAILPQVVKEVAKVGEINQKVEETLEDIKETTIEQAVKLKEAAEEKIIAVTGGSSSS